MDAVRSKNYLRRQMLQHRHNLAIETWREGSDRVCHHLQNYPRFTRSRTILAYHAFRQEVDLSSLFTHTRATYPSSDLNPLPICRDKPKTDEIVQNILLPTPHSQLPTIPASNLDRNQVIWGLPRCEGKSLIWHVWKPGESLVTGAYGILEPDRALPIVEPEKVDLMLIPAVAMDRRGYRLGYGGGYYDRMLADPVWARAFKIGIVFDFAYVEHLPVEDWDLPLDAIATESGICEIME